MYAGTYNIGNKYADDRADSMLCKHHLWCEQGKFIQGGSRIKPAAAFLSKKITIPLPRLPYYAKMSKYASPFTKAVVL